MSIFSTLSCLLTEEIHVVFGAPGGLFTGLRASLRAFFTGACSGSLETCPSHLSLLYLISSDQGFNFVMLYSLLLEIFFGHDVLVILLRRVLWNVST